MRRQEEISFTAASFLAAVFLFWPGGLLKKAAGMKWMALDPVVKEVEPLEFIHYSG